MSHATKLEMMEQEESQELVSLSATVPPSFSVEEYIQYVREDGYKNDYYNFDFDRMVEDLPRARKTYSVFANDILGKAILSHCYGDMLAKHFRTWVYSHLDESQMLPDAGASLGEDEEGFSPC